MSRASANVALAERFTQAVYAGDTQTLRSLLSEDFVLRQDRGLPYGGVYEGADGFVTFLQRFGEALEVESLQKVRTFVCAEDVDAVVFEFAFRGKLRATGAAFDTTLLERWNFRGQKIIGITPHWFEVPGTGTP